MPMVERKQNVIILTVIGIIFLLLLVGIPFYWVFNLSLTPSEEAYSPNLFPTNPTLNNYFDLFNPSKAAERATRFENFTGPLINSAVTAIIVTLSSMFLGSLAAYNLARFNYKGKTYASLYILFAYVFPPFFLMIPLYIVINMLKLGDSLFGLIIAHLAYTLPFSTWILRGYFMNLPKDIEDSALVDGCSRFQTLWKIVLPISAPGLVTAAIFSFTLSWDDLIFALVILSSPNNYTLPLAIAFFMQGGEVYAWGELAASTILATIPPVALYLLIQKYVISGLTGGAIKG
ncbi:MAG: carbohydrate ABC transporter permease [Nitrososphaeria archaeon]|nr:carbohydrate ABC transporter permease [Nitrososphaeria archaeon]